MYTVTVTNQVNIYDELYVLSLAKPEGFTFIPGQFILIEAVIEGKKVRRAYSIASGVDDATIDIYYREQSHGKLTPHLSQLSTKDTLTLLGPYGLFTPSKGTRNRVFIASGTGISPAISMIRSQVPFTNILYSVRTAPELVFVDEIRAHMRETGGTQSFFTTQETQGEAICRRISHEDIEPLTHKTTEFYICGSTPFVNAMKEILHECNVDKENIFTEKYGKITI